MPLEIKQLILVAVLIIIVIFLIVLFVVKHKSKNNKTYIKNTKNKKLDRRIRKYAKNKDFLILNNVFLPVDDTKAIIVDNLLFGNKYIYVISQKHWEGTLKGFEYDPKWLLTTKTITKYVDNPLIGNRFKVSTLMNFLNETDDENIVNIVTINDKTTFKDIKTQPLENVVTMSHLFKIIDDYEKNSHLNDIKEEEIERMANLVYEESLSIAKSQAR